MKPAAFEYAAPRSLNEALDILRERGDDAKVLAGGQSLVPAMSMRLSRPSTLVDINRIKEFGAEPRVEGTQLVIPPLVRHREIELCEIVRKSCPVLSESASHVGHIQIRHRGTLVGSIAHADPAAEFPLLAVLLGADVMIVGSTGRRTVGADSFYEGYFATAIAPGELIEEVRFPVLSNVGFGFEELSRRHGDYAIVAAAATVPRSKSSRPTGTRVAVGGLDGRAFRLRPIEALIDDQGLNDESIAAAGVIARTSGEPYGDIQASAEFKRELAGVLVERALAQCQPRSTEAGAA